MSEGYYHFPPNQVTSGNFPVKTDTSSPIIERDVKMEATLPDKLGDKKGPNSSAYEDNRTRLFFQNGDRYEGDLVDHKRHGQGTLHFADGSEYVGEWNNGVQHGLGTRRWKNGDCYNGQYFQGKRTGEGHFYFSNGDTFTGTFQEGLMHGYGRYYYKSGQRFEGSFFKGKRHGKGKLQRKDAFLDVGVFKHDVRFGVGVRWSPDRTRAWMMQDGKVIKKITVQEAIALDYEIDKVARTLDNHGDDREQAR